MQTLQSLFTNRFVLTAIIAVSLLASTLSFLPSFSNAQEVPEETTQTETIQCENGQVLNEAGDACVDEAPAPLVECSEGETLNVETNECEAGEVPNAQRNSNSGNEQITYCHVPPGNEGNPQTLTTSVHAYENAGHANHVNDYLGECVEEDSEVPQDDPYEDTEEDGVCLVVSDTLTYEGEVPAVLVSNPHTAWTAVLNELSKWIWGEDPTALSAGDEVQTFTRTFSVDGEPSGATLEIAADNGYAVTVNGDAVCADASEFNYNAGGQDTCSIPAESLQVGENTIEFVVTNKDQNGETPASNPGGLRYVLTVDGTDCGEPVENSCILPSSEGSTDEVAIGDAPGSEDELQEILDDEGYSLDANDDQVNTQKWTNSGDKVMFTVTNTAKNAAHSHVFGYYLNGGPFVPVFKNGTVGAALNGTPSLALGDDVAFEVEGVNEVVFAIADWNGSVFTYYATEKTMNPNGDDHTVVYNPENNTYVIAFEDLPLAGDHDYNDIVVTLVVDGCEKPDDTATVIATKIVCSDEAYLPNWGNNGPNITADTAADFLSEVNEGHENDPVCWLESGWQFQWAPPGTGNPGDNVGVAGEPWTLSGLTAVDGTVEINVPAAEGQTWFREVMQEGYVPFSADTTDPYDDVSAEMYCETDVLHYDNWDWINNVEEGETYHCIAINAEIEREPVCETKGNILENGGFELPAIALADWDIVPSESTGLEWLVEWNNPSGAPETANAEFHKNVSGWLPFEGLQYAELDSDWTGHTGSNGEAGAVTMSQTVATVPGVEYTFSFKFSPRPNTAEAENRVEALADGNVIGSTPDVAGGSNTMWTEYSFTYVAENTTTTFALRDADGNPNNSVGSFVDDASVRCDVPSEDDTTITVTKEVVGNQQYGADNFPLFVNETPVVSGVSTIVAPGSYTVHETGNPYFEATFSGACVADEMNETRYDNVQDWLAKKNALQAAIEAEEGDEEDDAVKAAMIEDIDVKIAALLSAITATVTVVEGDSAECTITNTYTTPEPQELTECFDGISNDQDGLTDEQDPGCHTDGDATDEDDTYDPNDNDENNGGDNDLPQCSDNVDNDGDEVSDENDPGCMSGEEGSYNPNDDSESATGTFTIVKHTSEDSGDGSFTFTIDTDDENSEDLMSDILSTVEGYATESYELVPGPYSVREMAQSGWTVYNVNCEGIEGSYSSGSLLGGAGADFTMHEGDNVTCHFYNAGNNDNDNEEFGECGDRQDNDDDGESDYEDDDCHTDGDASDDDETFDPNRDEDGDEDGGSTSGGRSNRSSGSVLGASTVAPNCSLLITKFMWPYSPTNDADQVRRLQEFLNLEMLSGLPITGYFGPMTEAAVKSFQLKYADKVLTPWIGIPGSGITSSTDATGNVFMSTAWMINEIICPDQNPFFPNLEQETSAPVQ